MLYISLLTRLVRNHSAFFWCTQRACRSAGTDGNCRKAKRGEAVGSHRIFPFHGEMSDARGRMLRPCQLCNAQLAFSSPRASHIPRPQPSGTAGLGNVGTTLESGEWISNSS